jgi:hypothetical protein
MKYNNLADRRRTTGAIGKAFLVYLGSGSLVAALIAYALFSGMGC